MESGQANSSTSERGSSSSNAALGGGEIVRVCNPCVPDPNFSPPPQQRPPYSPLSSHHHRQQPSLQQHGPMRFSFAPTESEADRDMPNPPPTPRYRPAQLASLPQNHGNFQGILSHPRNAFPQRREGNTGAFRTRRHTTQQELPYDLRVLSGNWPSVNQRHPPHHPRPTNPTFNNPFVLPPRLPPGFLPPSSEVEYPGTRTINFNAPLPPIPRPSGIPSPQAHVLPSVARRPPQPSQLPRQIAEEDECPVCGHELPPKGESGDEKDREQHIDQCIRDHAYGESPPPLHPNTFSSPSTSFVSSSAARVGQASSPSQNDSFHALSTPTRPSGPTRNSMPASSSRDTPPAVASASRPRRPTGTRMLVYRAGEKDCLDEDGGAQECVICFEEFEEGQEMGRLECLCKFHRVSALPFFFHMTPLEDRMMLLKPIVVI